VNIWRTVFLPSHKTATGWLRLCWVVRMSSSFTYLLHLLLVNTCVSCCHINLLSSPYSLFYSVLLRLQCQQVLLFIMQHTAILNRRNLLALESFRLQSKTSCLVSEWKQVSVWEVMEAGFQIDRQTGLHVPQTELKLIFLKNLYCKIVNCSSSSRRPKTTVILTRYEIYV
jgi:hypothetical protein